MDSELEVSNGNLAPISDSKTPEPFADKGPEADSRLELDDKPNTFVNCI